MTNIQQGNATACTVVTCVGKQSEREGICVYTCLIHLAYSRNKHNIAKQLHSKKLIKKKERNGKHGIRSHHFMATGRAKSGSSNIFYSLGLQNPLQMVTIAIKLKDAYTSEGELCQT